MTPPVAARTCPFEQTSGFIVEGHFRPVKDADSRRLTLGVRVSVAKLS